MGQVTFGEKRTGWNAPVPGMKFGYVFDGIGNRTAATVNGRTGTYTPDVANQYDERQVPGALDIRGRASTAARVTVNTALTQRLDDCQGNKVGSYTGTNGNIQTSSPFGPDYFDKFRNSKGVRPIYTVFVDTSVGVPRNLAGCQRGQLKISWRVKTVLGVDPASGLEGYNRPMDPNDVASDSSGFTGEKRHKHWLEGGEIADGRGVRDYTINVWWDWCGKNNKKEVHKLPEWETGPNIPNR